MRKSIALLCVCLLCVALCACEKQPAATTPEATTPDATTPAATGSDLGYDVDSSTASDIVQTNGDVTLGELVVLDGASPLALTAVELRGSQHDDKQNEGGRASFYLDETIRAYVTADAETLPQTVVYCVPHSDVVMGSYRRPAFEVAPVAAPEGEPCFSAGVPAMAFGEGLYDLVFTLQGTPVGYVVIELLPALEG